MLCLADINFYVLCLTSLTNNHTRVNLLTRSNKQYTSFLCIVKTISDTLAILKCNNRTLFTILNIALVLLITIKDSIDDTISLCISHEFTSVADKTTCRD